MKFHEAVEFCGVEKAEEIAKKSAFSQALDWDDGLGVVFKACLDDAERRPRNVGGKNESAEEAIDRWVAKYNVAYLTRPSNLKAKCPGTKPDEIIDKIIEARFPGLTSENVSEIKYAHRLSMSVENILGLFLEEYLAVKLKPYQWHCAWGETVKAVDFCHQDGRLLQVKNRSNTENSSSSKVREGTAIKKWFRVHANKDKYCWDELCEMTGENELSEEDFRGFVLDVIKKNPNCLVVDPESTWGKEE